MANKKKTKNDVKIRNFVGLIFLSNYRNILLYKITETITFTFGGEGYLIDATFAGSFFF